MVVFSFKHRWLHITDQVLEERSDHNVDDLANLKIDGICKSCARMESLEILTAGNILLSSLLVKLVQCRECKFFVVDRGAEIEGDVVHQEAGSRKEEISDKVLMIDRDMIRCVLTI